MKSIFLLILCASSVFAQGLRTVGGKVYDPRYSTNWTALPDSMCIMRVDQLLTNGVVIKEFQRNFVRTSPPNNWRQGTHGPAPQGYWQEFPGKEYVLQNYDDRKLASGQTLSKSVRAMRVGTLNVKGKEYALYDCGTPYVPPPQNR